MLKSNNYINNRVCRNNAKIISKICMASHQMVKMAEKDDNLALQAQPTPPSDGAIGDTHPIEQCT